MTSRRDPEIGDRPYDVFRSALVEALDNLEVGDGPLYDVSVTPASGKQTNVYATCRRPLDDAAVRAEILAGLTAPILRYPWRFLKVEMNTYGKVGIYLVIEARAGGKRPLATITIQDKTSKRPKDAMPMTEEGE